MQPPVFKRSKLPPEQQAIAMRLREERKLGRFSQAELAAESEIGRASLTHYEYAITALPFRAGIKLCRRLDLNPVWLATGKGMQRPYVPLSDLGLSSKIEDLYDGTFLAGCRELIAKPMRAWVRKLDDDAEFAGFIHKQANKNPFVRMSQNTIERNIRELSARILEAADPVQKSAFLENLIGAATELKRRVDKDESRQKDGLTFLKAIV